MYQFMCIYTIHQILLSAIRAASVGERLCEFLYEHLYRHQRRRLRRSGSARHVSDDVRKKKKGW